MANEIHIGQSHNIYRAEVHGTKADPRRRHGHTPGSVDRGGVGARAPGRFDIIFNEKEDEDGIGKDERGSCF